MLHTSNHGFNRMQRLRDVLLKHRRVCSRIQENVAPLKIWQGRNLLDCIRNVFVSDHREFQWTFHGALSDARRLPSVTALPAEKRRRCSPNVSKGNTLLLWMWDTGNYYFFGSKAIRFDNFVFMWGNVFFLCGSILAVVALSVRAERRFTVRLTWQSRNCRIWTSVWGARVSCVCEIKHTSFFWGDADSFLVVLSVHICGLHNLLFL